MAKASKALMIPEELHDEIKKRAKKAGLTMIAFLESLLK